MTNIQALSWIEIWIEIWNEIWIENEIEVAFLSAYKARYAQVDVQGRYLYVFGQKSRLGWVVIENHNLAGNGGVIRQTPALAMQRMGKTEV